MARTRARLTAVAAATLLTLSVSACGGGSGSGGGKKSAKDSGFAAEPGGVIVKAALKDMGTVKTMRVTGHMTIDGGPVTFDFSTDAAGTCGGTMGLGRGQATIVATKTAGFLKGDDAFWKEQAGKSAAQVQQMLAGRWAKTPPTGQITALCDIGHGLIDQVSGEDMVAAKAGKVSTLDGTPVVTVTSGSGKEKYEIVVELASPHHLRKLVSLTPGDEGEIAFSDFGRTKAIHVPAGSEFVDLKK